MPTNEVRRELLDRAKASGYPGSITEVFQAADQGIDLIEQHQMQEQQQQQMQVAETPEQQEVGLREEHAAGNTDAVMAFPDVQPGQSFNTVGMQAPIDIQKIDDQGHLVESYENVPPGIQDLPTGPYEGTVIESPSAYQKGGVKKKNKEIKDNIGFNEQYNLFYDKDIQKSYEQQRGRFSPRFIHDPKHYKKWKKEQEKFDVRSVQTGGYKPYDITQLLPEEKMSEQEMFRRQRYKESEFDSNAISDAGAMGIAQFMPETIEDMKSRNMVSKDFDPYNPQQAIPAQEKYMKWISERPYINKGTEEVVRAKVLGAYNMGIGNMKKTLTKMRKDGINIYDDTHWVKKIPQYHIKNNGDPNIETPDYINKVLLKNNKKFEKNYKRDVSKDLYKIKRRGGIRGTIEDLKDTGEDIKAYYDKVRKPTFIDRQNFKLKGDVDPFKQTLALNTKYNPTKNTTFTGGVQYGPGQKPQYTAGLNIRFKKGGYAQKYQLGGALQNIGAYAGYSDKGPQFQLEPSLNILGDACRTGQCFAESDKSLRIGPIISGKNFRMVEKPGVNTDLPGNKSPEGDFNLGGKLTYESIFSRGRGHWDYGHFGLEGRGGINLTDKSSFYESKMKLGILGRPDWGRYGYGAYARVGSNSGVGVGGYGRLGPLSGEAGYNFQTKSPEFKIGLGYKFKKGGLRKCKYGCW